MTNDQWNLFEQSMSMAPEITQTMYTTKKVEMDQTESLDLARVILSGITVLNHLQRGGSLTPQEMDTAMDDINRLISALYGRLMGLAKAYDSLVTKQVVLEAELASTGK